MHFRVRVGARAKTDVPTLTMSRVPACYFLGIYTKYCIVVVDKMAEPGDIRIFCVSPFPHYPPCPRRPQFLSSNPSPATGDPPRPRKPRCPRSRPHREWQDGRILHTTRTEASQCQSCRCAPPGTIIPSTSFVFYSLLFLYRILHSRLIHGRAQEHSFWYRLASSRNKSSII
jgi:hypothetical protein